MTSNSKVISNYFNSSDRDHYKNGSNVYFRNDTLYSYGTHFILAQKCKNGYILNGDSYSVTTSKHQSITRAEAPKNSPIIPFSALRNILKGVYLDAGISKIEIIDVTNDTYEEYTAYDKDSRPYTAIRHHLGASLIKYKNNYFLSSIDPSSRNHSYFLVQLSKKFGNPKTVNEAYRFLAGNLNDSEYTKYLEGIVKRQGEYFLIPIALTTKQLLAYTRLHNNKPSLKISKKIDLSRGRGNAHIASEYLKPKCDKYSYIRGTLRHNEHKMISLKNTWHAVVKNTAINSWSAWGNVD